MILVGGEPGVFERVRQVLEAFGQPQHVGDRRQAAWLSAALAREPDVRAGGYGQRPGAGAGSRHKAGAAMPVVSLARELYALAEPEHGREEMTALIEMYSK